MIAKKEINLFVFNFEIIGIWYEIELFNNFLGMIFEIFTIYISSLEIQIFSIFSHLPTLNLLNSSNNLYNILSIFSSISFFFIHSMSLFIQFSSAFTFLRTPDNWNIPWQKTLFQVNWIGRKLIKKKKKSLMGGKREWLPDFVVSELL